MINENFYADWIKILKDRLSGMGYSIPDNATSDQISIKYFNASLRRIKPAKRSIYTSAEFSCPSDLQGGLNAINKKIENGEDLTPHLSRGLKKAGKNDDLLNDWGVYHLHLGTVIEGDGFAKRSGPVLFALVIRKLILHLKKMKRGYGQIVKNTLLDYFCVTIQHLLANH